MLRMFFTLLAVLSALVGTSNAQSPSFESVARERAQIDIKRYAILRSHLDAAALPAAAQAEIAVLNESLRTIDQRYRESSSTTAGAGTYQLLTRTRELVAAEIAPSWNRLMLERFPLPEQIRRDFTDDARYAAALTVVGYEFTLGRTIRPPRTPELDARDAMYNQASEAARAPYRAKGEQSREWRVFERDTRALSQSAAFKREVLGRYVPLFASFVRDDPAPAPRKDKSSTEAAAEWLYQPIIGDEFSDYTVPRGAALAVLLVALMVGGGLVIPLWLSRRQGRRLNASRQRQPEVSPLALPPDLQVPILPAGLRPELFTENARVLDLQTWSETTVSWQSSSGNAYVAPQVSVRTSTVQKDRLWVETVDGREHAWTVTGGVFAANRGHFLTWVHARPRRGDPIPALIFNHNTQQWHEPDWLQTYRGTVLIRWLALSVLWFLPGFFALYWIVLAMKGPEDMVPRFFGYLAVLSLAWMTITHWWVSRRRQITWEHQYRPRVLAWLQGLHSSKDS